MQRHYQLMLAKVNRKNWAGVMPRSQSRVSRLESLRYSRLENLRYGNEPPRTKD
jgi:hypothetical protein